MHTQLAERGIVRNALALLIGACLCGMASGATYTISNTSATFGYVSFPATFNGTLLSTYSLKDGYIDTFTFKPTSSGYQTVSVSFSKLFGRNHSFRTRVYKGTVTKLTQWNNAGSAKVYFAKGQLYTITVQMLSPSSYTTTKYSYAVNVGGSSQADSYPALRPTASDGTYQSYVNVSWSSVSGATSYRLLRSTSTKYATASVIYTGSSRYHYDKTASLGRKYYYWVDYYKNGSWWKSEAKYDSGYRKVSITAYYPTSLKVGKTATLRLAVNGEYVTSGVAVSPKSCTYWKINWYKTYPYFAKVKGLKAGTKYVTITYGKTVTSSVKIPIKVVK